MNGSKSGRLSERRVERLLADPEPFEPPVGLLEALKAEIPPLDTLGTTPLKGPRPPRRGWVVPGSWLAAASVAFVLLGGTLAWRLWLRQPSLRPARTLGESVGEAAGGGTRTRAAEKRAPAEDAGPLSALALAPAPSPAVEASRPADLQPTLAPLPAEVPVEVSAGANANVPQIGARPGTAASEDSAPSKLAGGVPSGVMGGVAGGLPGGGMGGDGAGDAAARTLDERRRSTGSTISAEELARIPTAREREAPPLRVLQDKLNVGNVGSSGDVGGSGGNESSRQSDYAAPSPVPSVPAPVQAPKPAAARPEANAAWLDGELGKEGRSAPPEARAAGSAKEKQELKASAIQPLAPEARPSRPAVAAVPWRSGAGRFVVAIGLPGRGRVPQPGQDELRAQDEPEERDGRKKDRLDRIRDEGQSAGVELAEPQSAPRQPGGAALAVRFEPATVLRVRPAGGGWRAVGSWEPLSGTALLSSFEIEVRAGARDEALLAYLRMPDRSVPIHLSDLNTGWNAAPWELRAVVLRGELEAELRGERQAQSPRQRTALRAGARSLAEPHAGEARADEILNLVGRLEDAEAQHP